MAWNKPGVVEATAAAAPPQPRVDMPTPDSPFDFARNRLRLTAPLKTHQGAVSHLDFREATAGMYFLLGKGPFTFRPNLPDGTPQDPEVDFKLAKLWLEEFTGHDEAVLSALSVRDLFNCNTMMLAMLAKSLGPN